MILSNAVSDCVTSWILRYEYGGFRKVKESSAITHDVLRIDNVHKAECGNGKWVSPKEEWRPPEVVCFSRYHGLVQAKDLPAMTSHGRSFGRMGFLFAPWHMDIVLPVFVLPCYFGLIVRTTNQSALLAIALDHYTLQSTENGILRSVMGVDSRHS